MGSHQFDRPGGAATAVAPDEGGPLSYRVDAAQGPVRLRYFAPPGNLRRYFGALYIFNVDAPDYADVTRADVPQLRFMLEGGGTYHFHDGTEMPTPEICLLGPTMGATRFLLDRPARVVGVSLLPAGWITFHRGDASAMADRLCDVRKLAPGLGALLDGLRDLTDPEEMVARTWAALNQCIAPLPDATWTLLEAIDDWLMDEGSPRIDALKRSAGLSDRQIARLTNRYYGAAPKLLARKYRALRCSARIALDGVSWQQLCDDAGFYDQSHFIREIKHFIGLTPHQLMTEPSAVAQLTLLRRSLGSDVAVLNRLS
ncbi:MAG: AraC family transcriptional regulator [Sphingobium sp.]